MKTKVFPLKEGGEGKAYYPEHGEIYTSRFNVVGEKPHPAMSKEGKPIIIVSYFLGVTDSKGVELTLTLTKGMATILNKDGNLEGKKLEFKNYEHKEFGKLLGARVLKETPQVIKK